MAILIFLFLCLFFTNSVFATPIIHITVAPTTLNTGNTFPVQFTIQNSDPNVSYHYKFFGGIGDINDQIQTSSELTYKSSWDSFSIISVDVGGSAVVNAYADISTDKPSGSYNLYVRLAQADNHSKTYDSDFFTINNVIAPTPTCAYNYSSWSECSSSNTQTRTATLTSVSTCVGTSEVTTRSCTYTPPTSIPTSDPTIINPESGILLNEFMPYGSTNDKEWVELYNDNDKPVKLIAWKIMDNNSGTRSFDLSINAKSYGVVEFSSGFLNNYGDKVILINNNGKELDKWEYSGNNYTLDYSWSLVNKNWCRAAISKGSVNNQNCQSTSLSPSSSPTSTATPTPNSTKYTPDKSATASAIIEPTTESAFLSSTDNPQPTSTNDNGSVLGDSDTSSTGKKNYFALILIIVGALLLGSPVIINKLNKIKSQK